MKLLNMPESMKLASIWCVWAFLAIGAIGWALFVVLDAFGVADQAAGWVQAIGSIVALVGAAFLPIFHSKQKERRDELATLSQLRFIAEDCYERAWTLTNCFVNLDHEPRTIAGYINAGKHDEWMPLEHAATQFPLERVPAAYLTLLADLQATVLQSRAVCQKLPAWLQEGSNPQDVERLRFRRNALGKQLEELPYPAGLPSVAKVDQFIGAAIERNSRIPAGTPLFDAVLYINWYGGGGDPRWARLRLVTAEQVVLHLTIEQEFYPEWTDDMSGWKLMHAAASSLYQQHYNLL